MGHGIRKDSRERKNNAYIFSDESIAKDPDTRPIIDVLPLGGALRARIVRVMLVKPTEFYAVRSLGVAARK